MMNFKNLYNDHLSTSQTRGRLTAIIVGAALSALVTSASAAPLELNASGDAFISAAAPNTNYNNGSSDNLNAHKGGGGYDKDRHIFLKFNLSTYTGGTYSGSILTMIVQDMSPDNDQDFDVFGIPDLVGINEGFNEAAITFNNSGYGYTDGNQINTSGLTYVGSFTGLSPTDEGNDVSISTSALDTFLNNDTNNIASFIVVNTNGDGFFNKFDSKDASSGGSTLTVVPEPSSLAMMALGLLVFLGLSRKKHG